MIVSVDAHEIPVQLINQHFEIGIGGVGSGAGEHMILYFELFSRISLKTLRYKKMSKLKRRCLNCATTVNKQRYRSG